jgi:hypothetical protein
MKATPELERMLPRDIPEGSRTYHAYRMAHQHEYMVPIEVAWAMEQEITQLRADLNSRMNLWVKAAMRRDEWAEVASQLFDAMQGGRPHEQQEAIAAFSAQLLRDEEAGS